MNIMSKTILKNKRRQRRKKHTRKTAFGAPDRPRLTVFRSNTNIYAQVIDDLAGKTLVSVSSLDAGLKVAKGGNCEAATAVGKELAKQASAQGIKKVVFDRNGYKYHGRIRSLADAAREGGLAF